MAAPTINLICGYKSSATHIRLEHALIVETGLLLLSNATCAVDTTGATEHHLSLATCVGVVSYFRP